MPEYTPAQLADELYRAGQGLDVVELKVQTWDGVELVSGVVQLEVEYGHDTDRTGGYRWLRITGTLEPSTLRRMPRE